MPSAHARTSRSERENVDEDILAMGKGAYKVRVMCEALLLPSSYDDVCRWRLILCSPSISTRSRFEVYSLFSPSLLSPYSVVSYATAQAVHSTPLNHIGLWVDNLPVAVQWLSSQACSVSLSHACSPHSC